MANNNIGVYLDFDNVWGDILRKLGIDVEDRRRKGIPLLPTEAEILKEIILSFGKFLYQGLSAFFNGCWKRSLCESVCCIL
jgi:hypothetical protein